MARREVEEPIRALRAPHLFSLDIVAWRLRVSPKKVAELIRAGLLTPVWYGREMCITEDDLEDFMDSLTIEIIEGRAVRVAKTS